MSQPTAASPRSAAPAPASSGSPWVRALIPGILTLGVTLLRLWGELHDGSPKLFNRDPGGDGALVGIVWLVPLFGLWFAWRLGARGDLPASRTKGWALPLLGVALMFGWMAAVIGVLKTPFPRAIVFVAAGSIVCMLVAWRAWPGLSATLAVYGFLARVPVIVVTALSAYRGWDTHFDKMGPDNLAMPPAQKLIWTCVAQLGMWIPFTVLVGGFCGGLLALARGRDPRTS